MMELLAWTPERTVPESRQDWGLGYPAGTWWEAGDVGQHGWAVETQGPDGKVKSKQAKADLETC